MPKAEDPGKEEKATEKPTKQYVVFCMHCEKHVSATVVGDYNYWEEIFEEPFGYVLLRCPSCNEPMLGQQSFEDDGSDGYQAMEPRVIYPQRHRKLAFDVPRAIRSSYSEAVTCYSAGTYTASAIMCRKALEALVAAKAAKKSANLSSGLKDMRTAGLIDASLFEWAEMLRNSGNIAAHETGETVSKSDAHDLIEFTHALVEYVFTYKQRFEEFKKRAEKAAARKKIVRRQIAKKDATP